MKNTADIHFFRMAERALLIQWKAEVNETLLDKLLAVKAAIKKQKHADIVEVINTYDALLITYKFPIKNVEKEVQTLNDILRSTKEKETGEKYFFHLPVCYEDEFGWDISFVLESKKIEKENLIQLHTAPVYTVYFSGFLPGFPYLGGLSEKLFVDRKENPRKEIPKGAVGIGGTQTGIYPSNSPGGWQLIGNCPITLFNPQWEIPCLFKSGDKIKFYEVSIQEYQKIKKDIKNGIFQLKKEPWK